MTAARIAAIVCAMLLVVACGQTPGVAPSAIGSSQTPAASTSAAPTPSPSPDPEVLRKAAADAYLAAAKVANAAFATLGKKYPQDLSLKQVRAFYAASVKIETKFITALKKLVVPPDTVTDLKTLIVRHTALQALYIELSKSPSIGDANSARTDIARAERQASAAANQLRLDLGLPPVGS